MKPGLPLIPLGFIWTHSYSLWLLCDPGHLHLLSEEPGPHDQVPWDLLAPYLPTAGFTHYC